jgi:predicted Zn finger-like uncharacterized protein
VKFFCEQCKAKYQIADERVAGKTVRMKCRKCGHLVEVRATVTESSASVPPPAAAPASGTEAGSKPPAGPPKAPPKAPPPRPSALATSLTAAKPASARPDRPPPSALAGAFKANVTREEGGSTPFDMAELAPGDDWYVAVNGVPVGPIRIAEVRRKAALGAITEDSLAWQEGLDEWRPVKSFPELAVQVREAALGGRASLTPQPGDVRISIPPPSRLPSLRGSPSLAPQRLSIRPNFPPTSPAPLARSNVVPISSRLATAERLDEAPTEIGAYHALEARPVASMAPDPFAAPAAAMAAAAAAAGVAPHSASAIAAPGAAQPIVASASVLPPPARPVPWIPIAMVAGFVAFGITAAVMFFARPPAAPAVAAPVASVAVAPAAAPIASVTVATPTFGDPAASSSAEARVAAAGNHPSSAATSTGTLAPLAPLSTAKSLNLGGLGGHGPNVEDMESGGVPGQCISGSQVQQVIANHQVAIRRACWERSPSSKPSANVSVTMTVAGDGSAQGVTATGDDPAVAKCIETDVKNWHFPAMGCSQKTGFGFKFVRQ